MTRSPHHRRQRRRSGAILTFVCILLPVILLLIALVINVAWIDLCRTRTIIAADAATRAAGRTFAISGDPEQAKSKAREIAKLNTIAGKQALLEDSDFIFGQSSRSSDSSRYHFVPGGSSPNAMKISIKRLSSSSNGNISLLMPKVFEKSDFEFQKSAVTTRVDVDIAFVVDRSGSMIYAADEVATGFAPKAAPNWQPGDPVPSNSRWLDLAAAAEGFIKEMDSSALDEYVSLVTYSTNATLDRGIGNNYNNIRAGINQYSHSFPTGATNIGGGLEVGLGSLGAANSRSYASKVIILMTDGKLNAPPGSPQPLDVAKSAAKKGVVVFTITFADEADQALMQQVATAGNGLHFHASNGASLKTVLSTVVRMLPTVLTE